MDCGFFVGYDENRWVREQDYHAHPLEPALAAMRAARANTVPLLRRLTDEQWKRFGRHTGKRKNWKKAFVTLAAGHTLNLFE